MGSKYSDVHIDNGVYTLNKNLSLTNLDITESGFEYSVDFNDSVYSEEDAHTIACDFLKETVMGIIGNVK